MLIGGNLKNGHYDVTLFVSTVMPRDDTNDIINKNIDSL